MRVLLLHQSGEVFLELLNECRSLWSVSKFDKSLKHAASIMLEAELSVFVADHIHALLDQGVLLLTTHLLLLHQKLVVVDLNPTTHQF